MTRPYPLGPDTPAPPKARIGVDRRPAPTVAGADRTWRLGRQRGDRARNTPNMSLTAASRDVSGGTSSARSIVASIGGRVVLRVIDTETGPQSWVQHEGRNAGAGSHRVGRAGLPTLPRRGDVVPLPAELVVGDDDHRVLGAAAVPRSP